MRRCVPVVFYPILSNAPAPALIGKLRAKAGMDLPPCNAPLRNLDSALIQKRCAASHQLRFQFLRAIAITTRPRLTSIFVTAIPPGVRVFNAQQGEIFLPVRTLLRQRRIAEASLNPGSYTGCVHPGLVHIIYVLVPGD